MQQYQVPQFITVEDRIIGPLTLKQFLYLLGGAGVVVVGWTFLHVILFFTFVVPIAGLFAALAFGKVHGRPLPQILFAAVNYYLKPRLYLWRQVEEKRNAPSRVATETTGLPLGGIPPLVSSKLEDLAWSLDIKERLERE